jgi:hypothetical protein
MQPQSPGGPMMPPPQGQMMPNPGYQPQKPHSHLPWILGLIATVVLLLSAIGFGVWAFMERDTYKNRTDEIVGREVELAKQQTAEKETEFTEREKNPFKKYEGPSQFGGVGVTYPKTWAAFITETDDGSTNIDGYMHPGFVPGTRSGTAFALRIQVVNQSYADELKRFDSRVKRGDIKVRPFRAEKVPQALGSRIEGEINRGQRNYMVMLPLRDKTLKVWTEADTFLKDFNEIILPNLFFTP